MATLEEFSAFIDPRGWRYHEEDVPAGSYEDPATGEVVSWDAYTARTIYRQEPFGDAFLHHELSLSDDFLERPEEVWQMYVDVGNAEFEQLRERESAARV